MQRNLNVLVCWEFGFLHPRRFRRVWFGLWFGQNGVAEDIGKLAQRVTGGVIEGIEGNARGGVVDGFNKVRGGSLDDVH